MTCDVADVQCDVGCTGCLLCEVMCRMFNVTWDVQDVYCVR